MAFCWLIRTFLLRRKVLTFEKAKDIWLFAHLFVPLHDDMRKLLMICTLGMLLLASCSETKYVAEGQLLLDKVKVRSDVKDRAINTSELKSYVRQRGNSRWFSLIKVPLYTYSLSGRDTTRWLNRTLRSFGEPPQLYDSLLTAQSAVRLRDNLQNNGFLRARVDVSQIGRAHV